MVQPSPDHRCEWTERADRTARSGHPHRLARGAAGDQARKNAAVIVEPPVQRLDFLRSRLMDTYERIDRARAAAGRDDRVALVVVTKNFPASDVDLLVELGVTDVGENRDQEARAKKQEVHSSALRWHMIGRLQRNKASSVARWADVVESVDREALVRPLADGAARADRSDPLEILIQVNLDPGDRSDRGGAPADQVPALADAIAARPELRLGGVMAVAPHPDTGIEPLRAFSLLEHVAADVRAKWPHARTISAGMTGDLEQAVECGATQVRIGAAILGQRPAVQ